MTLRERFEAKLAPPDANGCRLWTAATDSKGHYGHFKVGGKHGRVVGAHQVAAFLKTGRWAEPGEEVLHSCDVKLCCAEEHVSYGTRQRNMADMVARERNRTPRPGNGYTKIAKEEHSRIADRYRAGENKSQLGRAYGVMPSRIRQILKEMGID